MLHKTAPRQRPSAHLWRAELQFRKGEKPFLTQSVAQPQRPMPAPLCARALALPAIGSCPTLYASATWRTVPPPLPVTTIWASRTITNWAAWTPPRKDDCGSAALSAQGRWMGGRHTRHPYPRAVRRRSRRVRRPLPRHCAPYVINCQFSDCTHTIEPGCAVIEATEEGNVSKHRYESYVRLREEHRKLADMYWWGINE